MTNDRADEKLIRMANQIAGFFRSYPEPVAVTGIQEHIRAFWTPRMRERLEQIARSSEITLDILVVKGFPRVRSQVSGRGPFALPSRRQATRSDR